jgi:hypothetical protein
MKVIGWSTKEGDRMFVITQGSGFQLTLGNGWMASVQFGAGNYASNRNTTFHAARKEDFWESNTAEIAAWYGEQEGNIRNWYNFGTDQVKGWCTADEVVEFLGMVSRLPPRKLTLADYRLASANRFFTLDKTVVAPI